MVTVTFHDKDLKPVPPSSQQVTAVAEAKGAKTKLEFDKKETAFVSRTPLPEGDGYIIVVSIKMEPDAKAQNYRIKYLTHLCGECHLVEYACICGH